MPANKNALIRYKTIDNCLRNRYRRWTLDDLVDACCEALYDMEGITKGVSVRTVQSDIQIMRSDKLGYNAPIEVYDHKYYRYSDADYSITNMPLTQNDYDLMQEAVDMLRQLEGFDQFTEMADMVSRLQDNLAISRTGRKAIIHFDSVPNLKGLSLLNPLYNYIVKRQTLCIHYKTFKADTQQEFIVSPYLLKEFRNRWFLFCDNAANHKLYNLALDRIIDVKPADITFQDNPDFDTDNFFDDIIGVSKNIGDTPKTIRFRSNSEQTNYIITKPLHKSQRIITKGDDGSCIFEIDVVVNFELFSVLMSYGSGIEVLSPQDVREEISNRFKIAASIYETLL
ncbi:MAG: WYL domain-containing protein [Prevotellaceae bacterium]|nr:WYL domain-containing protein [Prevotellaceae bacterium]